MTASCPFCALDASRIVFEDDLLLAAWDAFPVSEGHLLILTRRHVQNWFEASDAERQAITAAVARGRTVIENRFNPDGYNIGVNIGGAAGQTVPHLHLHLIPRYIGDVTDPRGGVRHVIPAKGNYLARSLAQSNRLSDPPATSMLVTGANDPLLPHLHACFDRSCTADLAVAFILKSGVRLLREHLQDLLNRGGRVRVVTGDYLDVTDPDALVELLDLGGDMQVRVFESAGTSFHPKAYIFHEADGGGTAFVGSSNLSLTALHDGVEWNYRVLRSHSGHGFLDVQCAFQDLFAHTRTRPVDEQWIANYRSRRRVITFPRAVEIVEDPPEQVPEPHAIQCEALAALAATRTAGNEAGLVVLATGLGKTWLAAFDSSRPEFRRVLFVAHREEILTQAMHTFRRIRPAARLGRYTGQEKAVDADVLFASIQTLGKMRHLELFPRDHFDYVIVDEFHHAAARTYRRLIEHFTPHFLLGLTATPERMDGGGLLTLCQENLVYRKDLVAGIELGLLCPFRYFGVPDDVDYTNIPWRSTRFDEEELTKAVATNQRAANALEQFRQRGGNRALGFCCSQRHADFMANYFGREGIRTVAVHSGETSAPRASALEALAGGNLDIIFAVDMFNEGLDIPTIDTVLMLRPTESSIVWLQQFGRGLRKADGKPDLAVIDYIGNHRSFLLNFRTLLQPVLGNQLESDTELSAAMRLIQQGELELPPGCQVTYDLETINILQSLLRIRATDDAIITFYEDYRQRHGVRPTAVQLYHSGYNPRSTRRTHGSWVKFLKVMGDLKAAEATGIDDAGPFLEALETTPMTKSFKMLTLEAMLNLDALPGQVAIADLTQEFRRLACRTQFLRADAGDALEDEAELRSLIERNPIQAWVDGRGTGQTSFFDWDGTRFRSKLSVSKDVRDLFQSLVRELVDWRLAEYLDRQRSPETGRFGCRVLQSQGRPILKLPNRERTQGVPIGWVTVMINGTPHVANFAKEFINVVKSEESTNENLLPAILQGWFGPNAGQPGTRFEVVVEPVGDVLEMKPVGDVQSGKTVELWRHYMREDIPQLFGLEFNTGLWNQGFIVTQNHVFLLVTLNKGGLNKEHRYEDRFLSADQFQWQSQNKTTRESKHGTLIHNHNAQKVNVHLFVRRNKLVDGKAAPFIYCGQLDFETWQGDSPITVTWKLREPVSKTLFRALDVPESGASPKA